MLPRPRFDFSTGAEERELHVRQAILPARLGLASWERRQDYLRHARRQLSDR